jgi:hypothetical protein
VECNAICGGDKKKRPVASTLGDFRVIRVVNWEEDVRRVSEIWKSFLPVF